MSEPTWTTIHIGGPLPANKIGELLDWADAFYDKDGDFSEKEIREAASENRSIMLQGLVNYGNPETLIDFCMENDLPFWLHFDAGHEWGPGIQVWKPGDDGVSECSANAEHDPITTLSEIRKLEDEGRLLREIIDDLARFECKVPAITITEAATEEVANG